MPDLGLEISPAEFLEWVPAEHLAIERDLPVVIVDIDSDQARGAVLVDHGEAGKAAGLPGCQMPATAPAGPAITA